MITTIQFKRGLSESWTSLNLILAPGEPGFEMDTGFLKIGDGETPWNDLPYINDIDDKEMIALTEEEIKEICK